MIQMTVYQVLSKGGRWLGTLRSWMQSLPQGDRLTWGSGDPVQTHVSALEHVGLRVAVSAVSEALEHIRICEVEVSRLGNSFGRFTVWGLNQDDMERNRTKAINDFTRGAQANVDVRCVTYRLDSDTFKLQQVGAFSTPLIQLLSKD